MLKLMLAEPPEAFALRTIWRNEPGPLSAVLVTVVLFPGEAKMAGVNATYKAAHTATRPIVVQYILSVRPEVGKLKVADLGQIGFADVQTANGRPIEFSVVFIHASH